ncbi:hypothetical protein B296_00020665 [Ensete ventricosum]|uniref:Leucine-rich repeat-containing N-terminal plant-type domain-containing protein n=1 Tax=Ensete ventricosum TaxID=4639 RepID=A0A426XUJ5_ENSVE|nr:hypothetical protein B296_00020665 [Ensete ventricosum]
MIAEHGTVSALESLAAQWKNTPPSWSRSDDPCGDDNWEGITCKDSRVKKLDLSYNRNLGGPLPPSIGNLKQLVVLSLNSNRFTGAIPASLGRLSNLTWLDLASNQLTGNLPTSSDGASGLDQLVNTLHL